MPSLGALVEQAKKTIPKTEVIFNAAWAQVQPKASQIRAGFGDVLVKLDTVATNIYLSHERRAIHHLAQCWLEQQRGTIRKRLEAVLREQGWEAFSDQAAELFAGFAQVVQMIEKDLGNKRKARGGATFERSVKQMLLTIQAQCEKPTKRVVKRLRQNGLIRLGVETALKRLGRVDLVLPDVQTALNEPDQAYFLTLKRTLRERWKQEVPTARVQQRYYLVTIDERISEDKADEINEMGLIAYVRDEIAARLKSKPWMRSLNRLPSDLGVR